MCGVCECLAGPGLAIEDERFGLGRLLVKAADREVYHLLEGRNVPGRWGRPRGELPVAGWAADCAGCSWCEFGFARRFPASLALLTHYVEGHRQP